MKANTPLKSSVIKMQFLILKKENPTAGAKRLIVASMVLYCVFYVLTMDLP